MCKGIIWSNYQVIQMAAMLENLQDMHLFIKWVLFCFQRVKNHLEQRQKFYCIHVSVCHMIFIVSFIYCSLYSRNLYWWVLFCCRACYYCKQCHGDVNDVRAIKKCRCKTCEWFLMIHNPGLVLAVHSFLKPVATLIHSVWCVSDCYIGLLWND